MSNIVIRHSQNGELRDRASISVQSARSLVNAGEVGVHVTGIATSARQFFTCRRNLAQCFAVVRHIGQQHQYVSLMMVGEVLGGSQRRAGSKQTHDRGIISPVDEQNRAIHCSAGLKLLDKEAHFPVSDADCRKDNCKWLTFPARSHSDMGLSRNLRSKLVSRQARAGKDWELLSANERVQTIDGRDAGLDEPTWVSSQHRVDGSAINIERFFWNDEG